MKKYVKSSYDENPLQDYFGFAQNICNEAERIKDEFYLINSYLKANRIQSADSIHSSMADNIRSLIRHLNSLEARTSDIISEKSLEVRTADTISENRNEV